MYPGAIVAGKYRVEHVLGRGGMGVVLAATHVHLGTRVALKLLNEGVSTDQKVVARFLREARASAQLKSEHVCRVSDFGTEGNVPYIVMELLDGTDLAKLVKVQPLDVATTAEYVMQACSGLAEAHAAQIIHRDLKPGNLFLTRTTSGAPLVKVLDFGVAKAPDTQDFSLTQTQNVVGSPGFMSPEQLRSSRQVDARSDVWSLGVILYKLTSGRQPFRADALTDLAIAIAMDPVPPLPEVSPAFSAIVMRCLEKDPARRFQTVTELSAALAPFATESRPTMAYFAPDSSIVDQSYIEPRGVLPRTVSDYGRHRPTLTPDHPTTLQGATSVVDTAAPPPRRSRSLAIGLSAAIAIAIGIVVAVNVTGGPTPAIVSRPMPVSPDPPAIVAPLVIPPLAAAALDAGVPDAAVVETTATPTPIPKTVRDATPTTRPTIKRPPAPIKKPKDFGESRI